MRWLTVDGVWSDAQKQETVHRDQQLGPRFLCLPGPIQSITSVDISQTERRWLPKMQVSRYNRISEQILAKFVLPETQLRSQSTWSWPAALRERIYKLLSPGPRNWCAVTPPERGPVSRTRHTFSALAHSRVTTPPASARSQSGCGRGARPPILRTDTVPSDFARETWSWHPGHWTFASTKELDPTNYKLTARVVIIKDYLIIIMICILTSIKMPDTS